MKYTLRIHQDNQEHIIGCEAGQTIAEALDLAGFAQELPCGGRGACGKCRVGASGAISPPDDMENALLRAAMQRGTRLSCRAKIAGDCVVCAMAGGRVKCI
jgi:ferredoxin